MKKEIMCMVLDKNGRNNDVCMMLMGRLEQHACKKVAILTYQMDGWGVVGQTLTARVSCRIRRKFIFRCP